MLDSFNIKTNTLNTFAFIANPDRESLKDYLTNQNAKRPQIFLDRYIYKHHGNSFAVGLYKESGLLNKIHSNYKRTCLNFCPGQAFMELSIIAGMCKDITGKQGNIEDYLDYLIPCICPIKNKLETLDSSLFENKELVKLIDNIEEGIEEVLLKRNTIKLILSEWNKKPISIHTTSYEYFRGLANAETKL